MSAITSFRGDNRFLSNFWPADVVFEGREYPSVENAYQASKTLDLSVRRQFEDCYAGDAKSKGKNIKVREDWDEVRYDIMYDLVKQKFEIPELRQKLLATGDAELIEGNNWGDKTWGCVNVEGDWVGDNLLGKILMDVRFSF